MQLRNKVDNRGFAGIKIIIAIVLIAVAIGVTYFLITQPQSTESNWKSHSNDTYSISYPSNFTLASDPFGAVIISFPQDYFNDSQNVISEAYVRVSTSNRTADSCYSSDYLGDFSKSLVPNSQKLSTINGVEFHGAVTESVAFGQRVESAVYSVIRDNACYLIELVAFSDSESDLNSLSQSDEEVLLIMSQILNTFKFTK